MAKQTLTDITGKQIADHLGIDISQYPILPQAGHGLRQPNELLNEETMYKVSKEFFNQLKKVSGSSYNTGEIWYDTGYEIFYLILGVNSQNIKEQLVLTLGGDTPYIGTIDKGIINSGTGPNIFCNKLIFKPTA